MPAATPPELRRYQKDCVERCRAAYRARHLAVLFQLATGGGKTLVFAHITRDANARGHRVLILVHLRELITQASEKLTWAGVPHGIVAAGFDRDHDAQVLVASVQTLNRRNLPPGIKLIVIDEAHHSRADTYMHIVKAYPGAWVLGVTATPERLDGKGLGQPLGLFTELIIGPSTHWLIDKGFLSPVRCFAPGGLDREALRVIHQQHGDYAMGEVEGLINRRVITGRIIEHYRARLDHQPTIVFCVSVRHAEDVAQAFAEAGYRAAWVDGHTGKAERERVIYGLGTGEIEVLTNCILISEGVDVPAVSGIIQARPTKSLVMHRQQIGRGMRPVDGKVLIVNDHVGNVVEHGIPEIEPNWQLDGRDRKGDSERAVVWICRRPLSEFEMCSYANPVHKLFCEACGAPKPTKPIEIPEEIDGRLHEVTLAAELARHGLTERRIGRIVADLVAKAAAAGHKDGAVYYQVIAKARLAKQAGKPDLAMVLLRDFAQWKGRKRGWATHEFDRL